jgi:hypothetical protein
MGRDRHGHRAKVATTRWPPHALLADFGDRRPKRPRGRAVRGRTPQASLRSCPRQELEGPIVDGYSWVQLLTRRVISHFLDVLARTHGWNRVYLVAPWISEITAPGVPSLAQVAKRLRDEHATAYVVTRPPVEEWHERALQILESSRRANIVLVPDLHTKLYCASTAEADFALFGSANLTQKSLQNLELGLFVNGAVEGRRFVKDLIYEAVMLYRSPGRMIRATQQFN